MCVLRALARLTRASGSSAPSARLRMLSMLTIRYALPALRALVPTTTGRSASAAMGPRSPPLASVRTVLHQTLLMLLIRSAQHVHLVRSRMGIVPHAWSALARLTRASGSSAPSVRLQMSSMPTIRRALHVRQELARMKPGQNVSAALVQPIQRLVSARAVQLRTSLMVLIGHAQAAVLDRCRTTIAQRV